MTQAPILLLIRNVEIYQDFKSELETRYLKQEYVCTISREIHYLGHMFFTVCIFLGPPGPVNMYSNQTTRKLYSTFSGVLKGGTQVNSN